MKSKLFCVLLILKSSLILAQTQDSIQTYIALRQILSDIGSEKDRKDAIKYEQGCVLNFLSYTEFDGYMPILVAKKSVPKIIKSQCARQQQSLQLIGAYLERIKLPHIQRSGKVWV